MKSGNEMNKQYQKSNYEEAIAATGYGRFHYGLIALIGWAAGAMVIEEMYIAYLLPAATCELQVTVAQLKINIFKYLKSLQKHVVIINM